MDCVLEHDPYALSKKPRQLSHILPLHTLTLETRVPSENTKSVESKHNGLVIPVGMVCLSSHFCMKTHGVEYFFIVAVAWTKHA